MRDESRPKGRPGEGAEAEPADDDRLWGINSVWEALQQSGRGLEEVLVERDKTSPRLQQIIDLARQVQWDGRPAIEASRVRLVDLSANQALTWAVSGGVVAPARTGTGTFRMPEQP